MTCTILSTGEELDLICKNEKEPPYPTIKAKLREKIWELYCQGYDRFYVNCEYGVPLWSAEIITALRIYNKIELHIVMPFEEQSTNWADEFRERFFRLHSLADSVHMITSHYSADCYEQAELYMTGHSDLALVIGSRNDRCDRDIQTEFLRIM